MVITSKVEQSQITLHFQFNKSVLLLQEINSKTCAIDVHKILHIRDFVTVALYKLTFTIPYHTVWETSKSTVGEPRLYRHGTA